MFKQNRLFWKLVWAFLMTLLLVAFMMSAMMVVMVSSERARSMENELYVHARDLSKLMGQSDFMSIWRRDTALTETLGWKIEQIREEYDADVWLVTAARSVWVVSGGAYDDSIINDENVIRELFNVLSGEEIRVEGLIPALGQRVLTVGVPWRDRAGWVAGAVLVHISLDDLTVDYADVITRAAQATIVAMLFGTVLAMIISKNQTDPLRQIQLTLADFSHGNFDRRVRVRGDYEIQQLARAFNQMAEDLSNLENSRRSFVANVSHELRSPLTCISGYVDGLLDGTIAENDREKYLNIVKSETVRLTKLVKELLDLSRIESGKMEFKPTPFDMCETARVELIKFERRIDEKRLEVEVNLPDEPVTVVFDRDAISQIMTNLIDNAVKYSDEGGRIVLNVGKSDAKCLVSIANTGEGIPDEDIKHIFDRFYKVDKAHTSGMGTGLGLSIVKKMLEQQGEAITVTSDTELTTFEFTLSLKN
ncbi:MAG: HAMP domain-containing sensor histidine kinase [Clostridia bacterium]|nr:HAMP domain-containing sensor histidine kinase [Clostridia bacterium]